ncbi:MAG: hypothetical protein VB858_19115 [Planctomycetaceae bacterium]|jgi:hypothetical protein
MSCPRATASSRSWASEYQAVQEQRLRANREFADILVKELFVRDLNTAGIVSVPVLKYIRLNDSDH